MLLADHGYLLGERGYTGKVPSQLHPELAQVPFVIVLPDDRAAGTVSNYFASTHDVGPTVLSMVGIDAPEWMTGSDLSVTLDGKEPAQKRDFHYGGGEIGYFTRELRVYDRGGQPCVACGTPVRHIVQGQRSTYFCPRCQ